MLTEAQIAKGQKNIDRIRSKENFHPALGKAARNESRKIRATYYNNVSIGLALAGALVPAITVLPKLMRSIIANFHYGNYFGDIPPKFWFQFCWV